MERVARGIWYQISPEEGQSAKDARRNMCRALWTGEVRNVKAGEWFLSGNPVEAYKAFDDIARPHAIAQVVPGKLIWVPHWAGDYYGAQAPAISPEETPQ